MKSLMDIYDILQDEDKKQVDKLFITLISKNDYNKYNEVSSFINNKYNESHIILTDVMMKIDIQKYLERYFNKYQKEKNELFSDLLTVELLNNQVLYNRYVRPIINMNENECFKRVKKNFDCQNNRYSNYDNPYYVKLMIAEFNKMAVKNGKLSIKQMETFLNFFIKQQANELNVKIDYKLIRITEYFKELLSKKGCKIAFQKIKEYTFTIATIRITGDSSLISVYISNYRTPYLTNKMRISELLRTVYHECRHLLQSSGINPLLSILDERSQALIKHEQSYYDKNHEFFEVEIDASIYGINKRRYVLEHYFPSLKPPTTDNIEKLILLTNKYQKRIEIERKTDEFLLKHPEYLIDKYELQKEYFLDGYPKGIMDFLKERRITNNPNDIAVYNEMIIRSLNRMDELTFLEEISFIKDACPFYLNYIEEAIKCQLEEISKVYSLINYEYQKNDINNYDIKFYQEKIASYSQRIQYYYQQLNEIKQMGVAKK